METTNQFTAVSEINGLTAFDDLLSVAVRETAARKVKAETVLSAVSTYEKISVSSSVIKSVLTSYLHEIDEDGFAVPSWKGRVLLTALKYEKNVFADIIKEPVKPQQPEKPAANDEAATNEYNRLLSDYNKEMSVYTAVMKERAAGVFRDDKRVFIFSQNPAAGVKPEEITVYLFSSLRLENGKFSAGMLSGDVGISNAAVLLESVGISNYVSAVERAAGLNYSLSEEEKRFISSYTGVSLSERGEMLLLKAHSENVAVLPDEEYEKAIKAAAKSIFNHLKKEGKTTAKKDRVIPAVCIELKKAY